MFIGHFGVGLAAKKIQPSISLGTFFIAVQFLDLLWPVLLLLDVEHVKINPESPIQPLEFIDYPISHSLLMSIVWGLLVGFVYWVLKKKSKGAFILFLAVVSHWILDLIVHFPDLPLFPGGSSLFGMGLWKSIPLTAIVEGSIFIIGVILYLQTTTARNLSGKIGFWILILLLVSLHILSIFSPPPHDVKTLAWSAQLMWVFVALGYWVDSNRTVKKSS